jgi:hypothetical protein
MAALLRSLETSLEDSSRFISNAAMLCSAEFKF